MTKSIFITGASSGIGAETARAAVQAGWRVGLFARSGDKLNALVDELGEDRAMALPGDVTALSDLTEALHTMQARWGDTSAVFANAGRGLDTPGTENGDPAEWEALVNTNILGLLYTVKAALPQLRRSKGHAVLTGSAAGRRTIKGSVYGASKWFVHGYGANLAEEMAEWGGRCTIVAPGMVDTPFFDEAKPDKLKPEDVANAVMLALEADPRCAVREVYMMPTR